MIFYDQLKGLVKEDCDYDYSLNSNDALARKYSQFSIFSYTTEFVIIYLTQIVSDESKSFILLLVFVLHTTKNAFLRLYYNSDIQKFLNICSIYCLFLSATISILLKFDNRPSNFICFILVIFIPITIKISSFLEGFQILWINQSIPIIQSIIFDSDNGQTKSDFIQYGNESILDSIIRRIYCNNNISEDILVYSIICNQKMNEKQLQKQQKEIQVNQKSASQMTNQSPTKKRSLYFDFDESVILGQENFNQSSRYLMLSENQIGNNQKGDYFINEQTLNGTIFISKEQVYGDDRNLNIAIQKIFQKLFNKLSKRINSNEQEKCSFLYLIFILQVLKNYQLFLMKYYNYTQQNNTSLKNKQKYYTLFHLFLSYTLGCKEFTSNNESDVHFSNEFLLAINFEDSLKESYSLLDKAVNLKTDLLYIMKQKYIELRGLIKKLRVLLQLRLTLRSKLNQLALMNQHNANLQFIYSVYLDCLSFTDRDIRINYNSYQNKQLNSQGQQNSNIIENLFKKNELVKKLFHKDVGFSFISMSEEKNSVIKRVSNNFCRIFERKEEELIGKNIEILMPRVFHKIHQIYVQKCIQVFNSINLHKSIIFGITQQGFIIPLEISLKFSQVSTQSEFGMSALVKNKQSQGLEYILFNSETNLVLGVTRQLQHIFFSNFKDFKVIELQKFFCFLKSQCTTQVKSKNEKNQENSFAQNLNIPQSQNYQQNSDIECLNSLQQEQNILDFIQLQNSSSQQLNDIYKKEFSYLLIIDKQRNDDKIFNSFEFYQMNITVQNLQADQLDLKYIQISNLHQLLIDLHSIQILSLLKSKESALYSNKTSFHQEQINKIAQRLSQVVLDQNISNNSISEKSDEEECSQQKTQRRQMNQKALNDKIENNSLLFIQSSPQIFQQSPCISPQAISIQDISGIGNNFFPISINNDKQNSLKETIQDQQQVVFQQTNQEDVFSHRILLSDPNLQCNIMSNSQLINQQEVYQKKINQLKPVEMIDLAYQNLNYDQQLSKSNLGTHQKSKKLSKVEQELQSSIFSNKIEEKSFQNRTTIFSIQKDQSQSQLLKLVNSQQHIQNQQKFYSRNYKVSNDILGNSEKRGINSNKARKNVFSNGDEDDDQVLKDKLDQSSTHSRESSVISTRNTLYRIINTKKSLSVMRIISVVGLICIVLIIAVTIQQYINCLNIFNDQIGDLEMFDWPISIASEMSLIQKNENLQNLIDNKAFNQTSSESLKQLQNQSQNELNQSFSSFQFLLSKMESPSPNRQIFEFVRNQNFTFGFVSQVIQRNNQNCKNQTGSGNQNNTSGSLNTNKTNSNGSNQDGTNQNKTNTNSGNSTSSGNTGKNSTSNNNNNNNSSGNSSNSNSNKTDYCNYNYSGNGSYNNYNKNKNYIVTNYSTTLDYSLILLSQYLFRYAFIGDNVGEQGFLQNQQLALDTLKLVYTSSKQDTFDQLQKTQQQLDQLMIVIIIINAICLITVFPLYSFIQQKRQEILALFGTFNAEKLDQKINIISKMYSLKNGLNNQIEANYQNFLKRQKEVYQKVDDIRKQSVSETSKLSRINKGVILLTIIVFGLSIIYPLLNKFVTTQFIEQSNENTALACNQFIFCIFQIILNCFFLITASIFEIKGFMLENQGENYLSMLLALVPNRKQYNLSSQMGQLTANVQEGNQLLSNLQQTIQAQQQFKRQLLFY